jgi:hypothetical protein
VAGQQSVGLSRASLHPQFLSVVADVFFGPASEPAHIRKAEDVRWRHFAWQIPTMLLGNAIVFVLVGLAIAVFTSASQATSWGPEANTAICFAVSLCFSLGSYIISWFQIELGLQVRLRAFH